jgi:adenylylsulfate kinase
MSFCLWITGLPGSGKSTIARALEPMLADSQIQYVTLSLDQLRGFLTPQPAYTDEERDIVYRALVMMAQLLVNHSAKSVIIDATGNRRKFRQLARERIAEFAEVYVSCPLNTCMKRESGREGGSVEEDLYQRAVEGSLEGKLPGVSVPYEEPEDPELIVHSDRLSPGEAAGKIMDYIRARWLNGNQG